MSASGSLCDNILWRILFIFLICVCGDLLLAVCVISILYKRTRNTRFILPSPYLIRERPLDFQGGPGFFSLSRIFFSVTFRAKIFFFQTIMSQNIFFSSHTGQEYCVLYNTNLKETFQLSRKSVTKLLYWGCLLSVCVCVRPRWL